MSLSVVGIDPSSRKIAIVVNTASTNFISTYEVKQGTLRPQACGEIDEYLGKLFTMLRSSYGDDLSVYVEEPVVGKNKRAGILQGQIHGVALASALRSGITSVYSISNTAWKKETVGSGNAGKDACREWLEREHPGLASDCGGDLDLIDAACIAAYGRAVLARAGRVPGRVPSTG